MTNAPQAEEPPLRPCSRVSASRALICTRPVRCRPKRIMITPALRASSDLYSARNWPTSVEIAPSVMKTMLKPMMKAAEFSITLRNSCPSCNFSSSTPTPEINETYPGTSGRTQGDRKEIRPATNTAAGNGKLCIRLYCNEGTGLPPFLTRCREGQNCYSIYAASLIPSEQAAERLHRKPGFGKGRTESRAATAAQPSRL